MAIIEPQPNLLLVASGDVFLEYDQGIRHLAAMPEEFRQAFLGNFVQFPQAFRDEATQAPY